MCVQKISIELRTRENNWDNNHLYRLCQSHSNKKKHKLCKIYQRNLSMQRYSEGWTRYEVFHIQQSSCVGGVPKLKRSLGGYIAKWDSIGVWHIQQLLSSCVTTIYTSKPWNVSYIHSKMPFEIFWNKQNTQLAGLAVLLGSNKTNKQTNKQINKQTKMQKLLQSQIYIKNLNSFSSRIEHHHKPSEIVFIQCWGKH